MTLVDVMNFVILNKELLAVGYTVFSVYKMIQLAHANGASNQECMNLVLNTLKDENKMEEGKKFSDATIVKVEQVAKVTGAAKKNVDAVIEMVNSFNNPDTKGWKVGSVKGKPIIVPVSLFPNVLKILGKIFSF